MSIEMKEPGKEPNKAPSKVKVTKADFMLQAKIGSGPLDERVVEACQKVMDRNDVDFTPLAVGFLSELEKAIEDTKKGKLKTKEAVKAMTSPVMQLKANAATFRYELIGNLANVMLSFLESIKSLDEDVISIVEAHQKTLSAILAKKMKGQGGEPGKQLEDELKDACKRYFRRKSSS